MQDIELLRVWLAVWAVGLLVILVTQRSRTLLGTGLVIAYLVRLGSTHVPGGLVQILPWYELPSLDVVEKGMRLSAYGVAGFVVGVTLLVPLVWRQRPPAPPEGAGGAAIPPRLPLIYVALAIVGFTALVPLLRAIPTLGALTTSLVLFLGAGCCLGYWGAHRRGDRPGAIRWAAFALSLPLLSVIAQGFLGYGTTVLLIVLAFIYVVVRPGWRAALLGLVLLYVGMSVYVTYMRDRGDIREVVWSGAAYSERAETTLSSFSDFELFNPYKQRHLRLIDDRLNQNALVGLSVDYLAAGYTDFAEGRTIWEAFLSLVPRALWPEKPVAVGSGDLFTEFTGVPVAPGTSVGIGQVMEFYINFGAAGVFVGFALFGLVLGLVDRLAALYLARDDWRRFTVCFIVGMTLIQPEGSLVDIFSSAGAAALTGVLVVLALSAALDPRHGPAGAASDTRLPAPAPGPRR